MALRQCRGRLCVLALRLVLACDRRRGVAAVFVHGGENATVLGTNDLKEEIMGTPAIAEGAIYIQTVNGLYCISSKK